MSPLVVAGTRLETARWDSPPPVPATLVLLHEGLGSVGLWRDFPARLATASGCAVFAYSRAGYGRSGTVALPRPLDYMRREAAGTVPGVLEATGAGPIVLVGHSDGATIAALYAAHADDPRLAGLVLIAPHFFAEEGCLAAIAAIRRDYDTTDLRARLARHHDDPDAAFLGWADSWLDPAFPRVLDMRADLPRITVPMLVLQGDSDPYGTDAHARLAERLCAGPVRSVILPARHAPHLEAPEAAMASIIGFLRGILGRLPQNEGKAAAARGPDAGRPT